MAAAGLVPALAGALPRWFAATRHSAFLYVASELVKVFGDQASLAPQLGAPQGCRPLAWPARGRSASLQACLAGLPGCYVTRPRAWGAQRFNKTAFCVAQLCSCRHG